MTCFWIFGVVLALAYAALEWGSNDLGPLD
jgi:hypothetical protein